MLNLDATINDLFNELSEECEDTIDHALKHIASAVNSNDDPEQVEQDCLIAASILLSLAWMILAQHILFLLPDSDIPAMFTFGTC